MLSRHLRPLIVFAILAGLFVAPAGAAERFITVASTTSTDNSGLFSAILPRFQQESGIAVRVIALGTGQAIKAAERGDADVLFVHHKPSEEQFVAAGFGVQRYDVMYNDFGSPGIPVVTGQSSLSHRAKLLEILG
jgi:tungstate transport system substrate-binding protein